MATSRWIVLLILSVPALAGEKDSFTLFNPTPARSMRELSTDRPDTTESPYTVDAGHFQIEMSFVDFAYDDDSGRTDTLTVLPINLKAGLLNNVDIQFVFDPYINQRSKSGGRSQRSDGFGDTTVRLKVNLWGNDEGPTALALMPYIKFPTASDDLGNDDVEGGLIIPFAMELPAGFSLGAMLEFDIVRDAEDRGYGLGILHTVTLGHELFMGLSGYVEYAGNAFVDAGSTYQAVVGGGLTYPIGENIQLDGGINFGISESADDYNVFVGMSFRI